MITFLYMVIKEKEPKKAFYSVQEAAKILGISRVAVLKKIHRGDIEAVRIGRPFAIPAAGFLSVANAPLSEKQKALLDRAVSRAIRDYGTALRQLGDA